MNNEIQIYKPEKKWTNLFNNIENISYPAEGVIRIFKGKFPKLKLKLKKSDKILILYCEILKYPMKIQCLPYNCHRSNEIINFKNIMLIQT